jgi:hypothetical protein
MKVAVIGIAEEGVDANVTLARPEGVLNIAVRDIKTIAIAAELGISPWIPITPDHIVDHDAITVTGETSA